MHAHLRMHTACRTLDANRSTEEVGLQPRSTTRNRTNETTIMRAEWTKHAYMHKTKHLQEFGPKPSNRANEGKFLMRMDASSRMLPFDGREICNKERQVFLGAPKDEEEAGPRLKAKGVSQVAGDICECLQVRETAFHTHAKQSMSP